MPSLFRTIRGVERTHVPSHWHVHSHHIGSFSRDIVHGMAYSAIWHAVGQVFFSARQFVAGAFSISQIVTCAIITIAILALAALLQRKLHA